MGGPMTPWGAPTIGAVKFGPAMMRPVIKNFHKGPVLAAAEGLPFVGKFLLQRNVV